MEPAEQAEFDETIAAVRARLGDQAFADAHGGGRTTQPDDAPPAALALAATPGPAAKPQHTRTLLTARERELAALIAQGLSNRQIASRLVIAERTAEGHVQSILNRLGFNSRAQIAARAVEHGVRAARPGTARRAENWVPPA